MSSLARSLVLKEKITTTAPKAKSLRPIVEKLVTKGKLNTLAARRALTVVVGETGSKKLVDVIGPKYSDRKGGYVRITPLSRRANDGTLMAMIEFV